MCSCSKCQEVKMCSNCGGTGLSYKLGVWLYLGPNGEAVPNEICPVCHGSGRISPTFNVIGTEDPLYKLWDNPDDEVYNR